MPSAYLRNIDALRQLPVAEVADPSGSLHYLGGPGAYSWQGFFSTSSSTTHGSTP